MLESIFGNKSAEKVLLHIFHHTESYASVISRDMKVSLTAVLNQLERFESGNILVSKEVGRTRLYFFNKKSPFTKPLLKILEIVYNSIPPKEQEALFKTRLRPRRKKKPKYERT